MKGIADTGFLVAFANRNDSHHAWAFHLQSVPTVLSMVAEGLVEIAFDCRTQLSQLTKLADRYADRNPDLADLCLIRMSELFPLHSVITVDRTDFHVYRRNRREVIPLIFPP